MASLTAFLNEPGEWEYFLSHHQDASKDIALDTFHSMKDLGKSCWLDVKMEDRDEAAMKEGIKNSKIILVIMSPMYFTRPFCVKELEWAVEYGKPIQVIIDVQYKNEIGNIIGRCPADKSYLKGIGKINFTEVFRGNPTFWNASIDLILKAKSKVLNKDGTVTVSNANKKATPQKSTADLKKQIEQLEEEERRIEMEKKMKDLLAKKEKRLKEEEERKRIEQEKKEEESRRKKEAEARRRKEAEARRKKEAEAQRKKEAEARRKREEEARRKKEEEQKIKIQKYTNGSVYEGQMKNGKKHGKGTYTWGDDGAVYVGEYKDGKKDGKGKMTYADGAVYDGDWKGGKRNGKGKDTYASGSVYVGEYKDDKEDGTGTYTYANGNVYVGDFKDGNSHGKGTFTYNSGPCKGDVYVGEWKDGKINGYGKYTNADGSIYHDGMWKDNKPVR